MNKNKIVKLQRKFTMVASLSFFIVMFLMGGLMYLANLAATQSEVRMVMKFIIENDGELRRDFRKMNPEMQNQEESDNTQDASKKDGSEEDATEDVTTNIVITTDDTKQDEGTAVVEIGSLEKIFGVGKWVYNSEEITYSIRYFAVLFDEEQNASEVKTNHIAAVQPDEALSYAEIVMNKRAKFGTYDGFYYQVAKKEDGGTIVVFIESLREIDSVNRMLYTALGLIAVGSIVTLILVRLFSKRIVKKEIESMEMQERFMTNASHELKTPLSVIKANTEVEQMLNGENEWNQSTMRQVERMTGLIQNLIRIVRAEEQEGSELIQKVEASQIVKETVDTFRPVASQDGKELEDTIESEVSCWMRETDLRQLISLFLDNAIKYCDDGGKISVQLNAKGRTMRLTVSNDYAEGKDVDYSRFFERFYRKDESHNIDKGGYGIGLSIAESIVERYRGTIGVHWKDGRIFFTCQFHNIKKLPGMERAERRKK